MSSILQLGATSVWAGGVSLDVLAIVVFAFIVLGANALLIRQSLHRPR